MKLIIPFLLLFIVVYTRFIGLDWGLPFPMHPDERNMVVALTQLECKNIRALDCFNPHFFAYGQFPLYISYILSSITFFLVHSISFHEHVTLALRFLSAISSILTVYLLIKTLSLVSNLNKLTRPMVFLIAVFIPSFIQFAHFGTTESVLMLFYTVLLYFAVKLLKQKISVYKFVIFSGIIFGLALGTKVSALFLGAIPFLALFFYTIRKPTEPYSQIVMGFINLVFLSFILFFLSSPFNFLGWEEFMGSMRYESDVGFGIYRAFYTRQFEYTIPVLYQFIKIFPYSLGWPVTILFLIGFIFLPYNKVNNFLRIQFLIFIIPNSFIYAKWTRFISPVFPLMVLFALLITERFISNVMVLFKNKFLFLKNGIIIILIFITIIPGIAYLSIYANPDVRFQTSKWVYENMKPGSYILSETANVIDVPIPNDLTDLKLIEGKQYKYISFNFYDIHLVPGLTDELEDHINKADYIFIPSRRVFANHSCYLEQPNGSFRIQRNHVGYVEDRCEKLRKDYPVVYGYYDRLFQGELPFKKVAEFSSFPKISLFGKTILEFPDEEAEETWTVFDHPVMRIYKRI